MGIGIGIGEGGWDRDMDIDRGMGYGEGQGGGITIIMHAAHTRTRHSESLIKPVPKNHPDHAFKNVWFLRVIDFQIFISAVS